MVFTLWRVLTPGYPFNVQRPRSVVVHDLSCTNGSEAGCRRLRHKMTLMSGHVQDLELLRPYLGRLPRSVAHFLGHLRTFVSSLKSVPSFARLAVSMMR
jgi:hypothetical protein